jgi:hypothetical protein
MIRVYPVVAFESQLPSGLRSITSSDRFPMTQEESSKRVSINSLAANLSNMFRYLILNNTVPDFPPLGGGLNTATRAVPGEAMSDAGMSAMS